ncbi:unnamed protein product, partial [Ilex paraguariensis]
AKISEDEKKALHVDLVKSEAQLCGLEEKNKSLHNRVSFLQKECHGLIKSKKNLELKCVKLDKDHHESNELSNRLSQSNEKFDRMLSMGKTMDDKCGLVYTNEHTNTFSNIVFVK